MTFQLSCDKYRQDVLIGNWFERRCHFTKDPHNFETTYGAYFSPKPFSKNDPAHVWDQLYKAQGYGARVLFDHQAPHFLENKSTTYDVAYNHIPKSSPSGPVPRSLRFKFQRYEPEQDYAKNYGNITKYGLVDYYKERWRGENQDPRTTLTSHYQDTFVSPKKEDFLFPRMGIPLPNSSALEEGNRQLRHLKLRGEQLSRVPENKLEQFPYKPRCNPISWECPTAFKEVANRCVAPPKSK